jgi:hypothetical protein
MSTTAVWVVAGLAGAVVLLALWVLALAGDIHALELGVQNANLRAAQAEEAADAWKASAQEYMNGRETTVPIQPRTGAQMRPILRPPRSEG